MGYTDRSVLGAAVVEKACARMAAIARRELTAEADSRACPVTRGRSTHHDDPLA
jgi:hypothetical protein